MRLLLLPVFVLSLVSAGCASRPDDTPISPDPAPRGPLPQDVASLGTPCPAEPEPQMNGTYKACGRDGKIGFVSIVGRTALPPGEKQLVGSRGNVLVVVESEHVWVQSTCLMCRTFMESTSVADLAHATDDQILGLQASAELMNKSPLRDPAAWRAAIAAWEPQK